MVVLGDLLTIHLHELVSIDSVLRHKNSFNFIFLVVRTAAKEN